MNEEMRDQGLDDRILSWLNSVQVYDDFSTFSGEPEQENLGRPCMNCRMRGGRDRPDLRKMGVPDFIMRASMRNRSDPPRYTDHQTATMQGVNQSKRPRGKGRGRNLIERQIQNTEVTQNDDQSHIALNDAVAIVEMAPLKKLVESLSSDDLARLRCATSYVKKAKRDTERLKQMLTHPPKEASLPCWITLIEMFIGRQSERELSDYPIQKVVATCVAFEADSQLHDFLTQTIDEHNVPYVMWYLAEKCWLSTSSGEAVCDYLDELGITTDFALDLMRTASGSLDPKELDTCIKSMSYTAEDVDKKPRTNILDILISSD